MNRNTNFTLFALMALEMAIIAELMNNLTFVVEDSPNMDDYDDYDFPKTENYCGLPIVDEETYGEKDIVDWLTNECGLNVNKSATEYSPNTKMMALSVDEMRQIKREMDILRVRANEGEELARKIRNLHEEFFPSV